jgi:NAD(P)-dependent dehydrogenase (short-subunit alcohol dehydrogenase family)/acyl carrier protein
VKAARPDARYWAFDLGEVALREPELIQTMLKEISAGIRAGELRPLPLRTFAMREAEQAFRWMAGGRHIGKLVLMREPRRMSREAWVDGLRAGAALITGGTGALGLAAARWLLAQGARRVVLVSRGGGADAALALAAEFAGRVVVEAADVADRAVMRAVLERARLDAPLRVVIHAAGEVRDGLLADATAESLTAALRTKVEGAKVLAELTAGDDLLATVYYGSLTAVVGSAGQAGYAAANAYLDGLAEERSARGLRTLSLDWGAWAEGGMTERLSEAAAARVARQGIRRMAPGAALAAMEEAILSGRTRVAVADVDWEAFAAQFPGGAPARVFMEELLPVGRKRTGQSGMQKNAGAGASISDGAVRNEETTEMAAIAGALKAERLPRMETYVRGAARKVLGLSASRPMPAETALQDMGLDSLMALELRNVLAQAMGRPLSATLLFDYPTVRGLAGFLLGLVEASAIGEKHTAGAKAPSQAADGIAGAEAPAYLVPAFRIDDASTVRNTSTDGASTKDALIQEASTFEAELVAMSDAEAEELLLAELERKGVS